MTRQDRDYDDILSRVLHSTLDPVEPAGDGLAKIQKRIAEPWLKRRMSLLRTELTALAWLILVRCEPFLSRARSGLAATTAGSRRRVGTAPPALGGAIAQASSGRAARRGGLRDAGLRRWVGPTMAWLRPTLAVGGAVVIVVAGVFALGQFREAFINPADNGSANSTGGSHGHAAKPGPASGFTGAGPASSRGTSDSSQAHKPTSQPASKGTAKPSPSCSARPSPSASPSPSTSPSPSPTMTSPSPSPTTPSPTTSPTSGSGGGGGAPSPTLSPSNSGTAAAGAVVFPGHVVFGSCKTASPRHTAASPPAAS